MNIDSLTSRLVANKRLLTIIIAVGAVTAFLIWRQNDIQRYGTRHELVGNVAPELNLPELGQEERVELEDYRGRVVLLDFWATWCGPCERQVPSLRYVRGQFEDDELEIISVNTDSASPRRIPLVRRWLHDHVLDATHALDENGRAQIMYGVETIPTLVVIGPNGVVERVYRGVTNRNLLKRGIADALRHPSEVGADDAQ